MHLTLCGCKQNQKKNTILSDVIKFWESCKLLQKQLDDSLCILIWIFDYSFALNNYYADITSHYSDFFLWHSRQSKEKSKPVKILKKLTFIYQSRLISITPTLTLIILDITKPHSLIIYYLATQPTDWLTCVWR